MHAKHDGAGPLKRAARFARVNLFAGEAGRAYRLEPNGFDN